MKADELIRRRVTAYQRIFTSPDGKAILEDLQKQFGGTTLRKVDGVVDANASLAAAGCREVVLYIEQMTNVKMREEEDAAA